MKILDKIAQARARHHILPSTADHLEKWLAMELPSWARGSIDELIFADAWQELDERFFREIAFGTGGMRSRTFGRIITSAERGAAAADEAPKHAGVGSNFLNDLTVVRATLGLFSYARRHLDLIHSDARPRLVVAHDVRHFSRHFCELVASAWTRSGGDAFIFDGPRSTPQLSYTVRYMKAHCGIVITASHNPPHDNGYKVYFADGGQVVPPHANSIVDAVAQVPWSLVTENLERDLDKVVVLSEVVEEAYRKTALETVLRPLNSVTGCIPRIAFSALHGTGGIATVPLLRRAGAEVWEVESQREPDPDFSTVKSPNPENAAALTEAVALARRERLDVALATDPDGDRVGVAARDGRGEYVILTGNQIGALLADFRLRRLKAEGWIPHAPCDRVALIKTFVTSPLQEAIGHDHGVKVINTLTGFKWIGERLHLYERNLRRGLTASGQTTDYTRLPARERARLLQQHSTFFAFGGEESYGYLPIEAVRDKDASASALAIAEMVADAKDRGTTLPDLLVELYRQHGYHAEDVAQLVCEGAAGAAKIARILASLRERPPVSAGELRVDRWTDFGREDIVDADGVTVPKEDFYFIDFSNGYRCAIRGSGTEPKLKFYLFAREPLSDPAELSTLTQQVSARLKLLGEQILAEAEARG